MPDPPAHLPGPGLADFKNWKPEAQQRALELLREYQSSTWRPFYCPDLTCDGRPHDDWDWEHARVDQRPPRWADDWLTWLLSGGRGSGKTRTGAEVTHRVSEKTPRLGLVAATGPDLREIMIEGVSGILACSPPGKRPLWEPSKKKLTWPNGCIGQGFSAEEPDRLRGPENGFIWADEPGHWDLASACWDNMLFGLRKDQVKIVATSTPKPTTFFKGLVKDPTTVLSRVSTYANVHNLAPAFAAIILAKYEGTRLGRQELHGEILEDVEGALWKWDMFEWVPEDKVPAMVRMVTSVDPAGTTNKRSDETGIVTVGIGEDRCLYVWSDATGKYSPAAWGAKANAEHDYHKADAIVAEKNYGADMVRYVLENAGYTGARVIEVDSRRGKAIRAEPIVALYEKHRVKHVGKQGDLADLENEQTTWVPGEGDSPNRVDALVHACTELAKLTMPAAIADPTKLLKDHRVPVARHLGGLKPY
jgi:phage terminase large subunit-like protein